MKTGYTLSELKIGQTASFSKTISESDVYSFAGITGDFNPAHVDSISASQGLFKKRVAHGILVSGLISTVLGTQLPGNGTIYLGQNLKFVHPVYFGDTVTAILTVDSIDKEKCLTILDTTCVNQDGTIVIKGQATVRPPQ